jgi:hypothetical protein
MGKTTKEDATNFSNPLESEDEEQGVGSEQTSSGSSSVMSASVPLIVAAVAIVMAMIAIAMTQGVDDYDVVDNAHHPTPGPSPCAMGRLMHGGLTLDAT